jgi:N6-adenosine-specific RNA methylase IME4
VKDRMGTGEWLRGQTEHCLVCARGKPVVRLTNQTTVLNGVRREHSRKPDDFYLLVEQLCPGNKLELFARQVRDGWQAYGNMVRTFQGAVALGANTYLEGEIDG